jgi:hypothetical protein
MLAAGCGKKGDPILPQRMRPPAVTGLAASSTDGGIALSWTISGLRGQLASFRVLRSETIDAGRACPGCPQDHRLYDTIPFGDDRLKSQGERGFLSVDAGVREGGFYSYRVAACDRNGVCGEPSDPAALIHRPR